VIGVGIGGTADYANLLAKKALLKDITHSASRLESDLLNEINRLNIGPMGLGGKATALAVKIETHPMHITGLPVAVNISCHALRSSSAIL
jgi:fumarate hydratase subunit alpha